MNRLPPEPADYAERVRKLEDEGLTTSDAQAVVDAELRKAVKYPHVKVKLVGTDGNAFAIMGKVQAALKRAKVPADQISDYMKESMSGDYDHLLATACQWVSVS